jgi:hypothetical protein
MSAIGPKQTWTIAPHMSAFMGKADMTFCGSRFRGRYWVQSGHCGLRRTCLLLTQSEHRRFRIAAAQTDPEPHFAGRKRLM